MRILRWRPLVFMGLLATLTLGWVLSADSLLLNLTPWIWIFFLALPAISMSRSLAFLWVFLVATIAWGGHEGSLYKIALTQMPITFQDVQIAIENPSGFWEALSVRWYIRYSAVLMLLIIGLLFCIGILLELKRLFRAPWHLRVGIFLMGVFLYGYSLVGFSNACYSAVKHDPHYQGLWAPSNLEQIFNKIGFYAFLDFTRHNFLDQQGEGDFFNKSILDTSLPEDENNFYSRVAINSKKSSTVNPNIVFMLLESTFNPAINFHIKGEFHSKLFISNSSTRMIAPFYVNAVGGGTWLTEFETIAGMDSRVFGAYGLYTHSSISPHIHQSFATYLNDKGYETLAFIPTPGDFYNSKNAYRNYGFKQFYEMNDIGLPASWENVTDKLMVEKVIPKIASLAPRPLFVYIVTLENHGPHRCRKDSASEYAVRLSDSSADPSLNCQLNEFNRRLYSTEQSVFAMLDFLKKTERETGRPFVLAVFGDHLPHTFVNSLYGSNFSAYRTQAPINQTFVHIMSSAQSTVNCCEGVIPSYLLPTLVSTYLPNTLPNNLFLKTNFDLYKACGTDVIASYRETQSDMNEGCRIQYPRSLKIYHNQLSPSFR